MDDGVRARHGVTDERGVRHVPDDDPLSLDPELALVAEHRRHADAKAPQVTDDRPAQEARGTGHEHVAGE